MHKVVQAWFVLHESLHTTMFGIYYCVEIVRTQKIFICLKLRSKLLFLGFQSFFGTFSRKLVQTWFVLHEI